MSNPAFDGARLLSEWRARTDTSQSAVASGLHDADGEAITQPAVAAWERGRQRPGLLLAVQLERLTGGAVRIEAWGYDRAKVLDALGSLQCNDATPPHTASDFLATTLVALTDGGG